MHAPGIDYVVMSIKEQTKQLPTYFPLIWSSKILPTLKSTTTNSSASLSLCLLECKAVVTQVATLWQSKGKPTGAN